MIENVRIIISAHYDRFIELARSVEHALYKFGAGSVIIQDDVDVNFSDGSFTMNIVFPALKYFNMDRLKGYKIIYQTEELWNRRERKVYDMCQGYDRALEMYDENVKIPSGTENVVYCPVGYSPVWESDLPQADEEIDVLFYGSIIDRRIIFKREFKELGFTSLFIDGHYGNSRDELIKMSKIVLNIKCRDLWSYGPMHCLPAQANKKFMLAEKANGGYGPFKSGIHFVEYDGVDDCKEKIRYWLAHDEERNQFAINAYNDMVKTCDFTEIFKKAMGSHPSKNLPSLI